MTGNNYDHGRIKTIDNRDPAHRARDKGGY